MVARTYSRTDLMKIAVEEHLKSTEYPKVGAVIAKDGALLATGFRGEVEKLHAERVAIGKLCSDQLKNSELYTTLEPCVEIHDNQIESCSDLIINSKISEVVIGVLDPNGSIYSKGYQKLLENEIAVSFFNRRLRQAVEEQTFEYGLVEKIFGSGTRRLPVVNSGTSLTMQFSEEDDRSMNFRFATLQPSYGCVDLVAANGAVRIASGARTFGDISDPLVFRFPSHVARMQEGTIAIVQPKGSSFFVLIEVMELFENDILFRWQARNSP